MYFYSVSTIQVFENQLISLTLQALENQSKLYWYFKSVSTLQVYENQLTLQMYLKISFNFTVVFENQFNFTGIWKSV